MGSRYSADVVEDKVMQLKLYFFFFVLAVGFHCLSCNSSVLAFACRLLVWGEMPILHGLSFQATQWLRKGLYGQSALQMYQLIYTGHGPPHLFKHVLVA